VIASANLYRRILNRSGIVVFSQANASTCHNHPVCRFDLKEPYRGYSYPSLVSYYTPKADEIFEDKDLVITGEDRDTGYDSDDDGDEPDEEDKPIRVLSDFSIFDPKHRMEMVSLSAMEEDDGVDRQFEGAGLVTAYSLNDEDEGQEDDIDSEPQYIRLGAILRYTIDYGQEDE